MKNHGLLFIITAVVCVVLSFISVSSLAIAKNNMSLTNLAIENESNYYKADKNAVKIISDMMNGETPSTVEIESNRNKDNISYKVAIDNNSRLDIEIERTDDEYKILKWNMVND